MLCLMVHQFQHLSLLAPLADSVVCLDAGWCLLQRCPRRPVGLPTSYCGCQQRPLPSCQCALSFPRVGTHTLTSA